MSWRCASVHVANELLPILGRWGCNCGRRSQQPSAIDVAISHNPSSFTCCQTHRAMEILTILEAWVQAEHTKPRARPLETSSWRELETDSVSRVQEHLHTTIVTYAPTRLSRILISLPVCAIPLSISAMHTSGERGTTGSIWCFHPSVLFKRGMLTNRWQAGRSPWNASRQVRLDRFALSESLLVSSRTWMRGNLIYLNHNQTEWT